MKQISLPCYISQRLVLVIAAAEQKQANFQQNSFEQDFKKGEL